jgi:hypothetical protein
MAVGQPEAVAEGWHIPLVGAKVSEVTIGHALGLLLWVDTRTSVSLRIEASFRYTEDSRTEVIEWEDPAELGRFSSLFGAVALSVDLKTKGDLDLRFADGRRIEIAPDPNYEAYDFSSGATGVADGGWKFICRPGGGLAEWA